MIPSDALLTRSHDALSSAFEEEAVLMRLSTGKFFTLDSIGSRIWDHLAEPTTLDGLVMRLVVEFRVEPDRCRRDTEAFLDQLLQWGLAERRDSAG